VSALAPRRSWLVVALALEMLALCAGHAARAEANDAAQARVRISAQRAEAKSSLTEKERACRHEFVVAPCVEGVRKEQLAVLARLRNEELALDDARRKESAARRLQELLDKAAARNAKAQVVEVDAAAPKADPVTPKAAPAASQAADGSAPARAGANAVGRSRGADKGPSKAGRAAQEDSNRAQFEARTGSAQAHREAVEQRNAERALKGKKANPLQVPAAAFAPAGSASAK